MRPGRWRGTSALFPLDLALLQQRLEHCLVVALASRYQQHQRFAVSVRSYMDLRAEPAATSPQGFARLASPGASGVLVSAHDRAVEEVQRPAQLAMLICAAL